MTTSLLLCLFLCSDQSIQDEKMRKLESPKTCYWTIRFRSPKLFPAMSRESERHHESDKGSFDLGTHLGGMGRLVLQLFIVVISSTVRQTWSLLYGYTNLCSFIFICCLWRLIKPICSDVLFWFSIISESCKVRSELTYFKLSTWFWPDMRPVNFKKPKEFWKTKPSAFCICPSTNYPFQNPNMKCLLTIWKDVQHRSTLIQ